MRSFHFGIKIGSVGQCLSSLVRLRISCFSKNALQTNLLLHEFYDNIISTVIFCLITLASEFLLVTGFIISLLLNV